MKNTSHQYLNFDFAKQVPWNCWSIFWNIVLHELFWILNCPVVYVTTREKALFFVKKKQEKSFFFPKIFFKHSFRKFFCMHCRGKE